ncbi:MAG: hypothetical protein ALECFALPRED_005451 [Alectoria fallacina]|uniref:Aminoglycoside phosphotransferase domain-containing protein n=1 Tax=Alectoria fallacina TaxID=1903189 RepID=A0A8H3IUM4_9LECA|nr:MAG: hypothetical protein ALECFALPRED_005451 [Alectoria fallacina]
MIQRYLLRWEGNFNRMPEWVRELDEAVIRSIAKQHLAPELPSPLDEGSLDVSFFTEGAFNKLYLISYAGHHTEYIFRVSLPVEPYFKTESEVATLAFLGSKSSIPVARVVAWDSNSDNELGFEWTLMERVNGVTLQSVWREMSWQGKLVLTAEVARMIKHLRDITFDRIGSLYFESALTEELDKRNKGGYGKDGSLSEAREQQDVRGFEASTRPITNSLFQVQDTDDTIQAQKTQAEAVAASEKIHNDKGEEFQEKETSKKEAFGIPRRTSPPKRIDHNNLGGFVIGPLFDRIFFMDDRVYLPGDRGPYESSQEMLRAEVDMQLEWIMNGRSIMHSKSLLAEAGYCEDDFEQEAPTIEAVSHAFLDILPQICRHEGREQAFTLEHHDLNASNILVDPTSYKITGVVDWEMTCLVPSWMASGHPVFLQDIDLSTSDEIEPPIPSYEHEHDEDIDSEEETAIMERDRWESKHLRGHFDSTMNALTVDDDGFVADDDWEAETKRNFKRFAWELTENTSWSADWLKEYHAGIGGLEPNVRQNISEAEVEKLIAERKFRQGHAASADNFGLADADNGSEHADSSLDS